MQKQKTGRKLRRKIIIAILITAVVVIAAVGGVLLYQRFNKTEVNVYAISDLNVGDWGDSSSISGTVSNSAAQEITLDADKTVKKVYVKDGDKVKKGDKLFKYDATLSELELESGKLNKQSLELKVKTLKDQIANPKKYLEEEYELGDGGSVDGSDEDSSDDSDDSEDDSNSSVLSGKSANDSALSAKSSNESVLSGKSSGGSVADEDDSDGNEATTTVDPDKGTANAGGSDGGGTDTGDDPGDSDGADDVPQINITQTDINEYVAEKKSELREAQLDLSKSELEVSKLEKALSGMTVKSTMDGIVRMGDEGAETYMTVQAEEGLYIEGTLNEYLLDTVKVGDVLEGEDYYTGETFTAEIQKISEFPAESGADMYYDGSSGENVSYYSFSASIVEDADASVGDEVNLTFQNNSSEEAISLEKAFVLNENGNNYVYVNDEKEMKLKKQKVEVGKTIEGSIVEIESGITLDDYIAFPYGKEIKEGVNTKKAAIDKLYE